VEQEERRWRYRLDKCPKIRVRNRAGTVPLKREIPPPDHASKKAIHEERSHSDTHKDKDDNRGTARC